jgi:heme/copper-type cytochrome/quinol oxidase subunit 3
MELSAPRPGQIDRARVGVYVFLATEVMFFAGLFSAWVVLAPRRSAEPDLPLALAMTALLLSSSACLHAALAARDTSRGRSLALGFAALLLGVLFLVAMAWEWGALLAAGEHPSTDLWWACFFVLTGMHGLHVAAGAIWLACGWFAQARGGRGRALELAAPYWHFVDLVWLVLLWALYFD